MLRILFFALICAIVLPASAGATGLVRVQQSDGSIQEYPGATIRYSKDERSLSITTADGKGTLLIDQAACSYIGELYRCLLTHITLSQGGGTHPLDFQYGTIYANTTGDKLTLPSSSQAIPPRGVVMALKTKLGTYITLTGMIDSGVR